MEKYDAVIVGAGIAGMTAAIYAARAGKNILVLEEKMEGGQIINTINIENWPGDMGVSGAELVKKVRTQMEELGGKLEYEKVEKITKSNDGFTVKTDENEYGCKTVVIATGTEPRKMSLKQTESAGVRPISYCATCDGALYKGKTVVVVGHGNTAEHEISYLNNICAKVYQIHHDEEIPEDAEAVFVAIGRIPNTKAFEGLVKMDNEGYIVAGEDCKTSEPGIFVAGDCRTKKVNQLVTAAADGAVAASMI